ncbi:MAG: serine dehydratase subunit alpha family protein [Bacteroidales bacterium]|nr:serine dehydratase subunit alpha family protein [Bacteroidales bacterium]
MNYDEFIALIRREVKPALGCTEPIAVALASARACEELRTCGKEPNTIEVEVSPNILKNGMGVGIPGTGMVGLHIAAALGAVCGRSKYGLEVLHELCSESVSLAKAMTEEGRVKVSLAQTSEVLYVKGCASSGSHRAEAVISGSHDNIVSVSFDGAERLSATQGCNCDSSSPAAPDYDPDMARKITVRQIFDFACNVPLEKIEFMMESVEMNKRLSNEGITHPYGLQVGRTLLAEDNSPVYGDNLLTYAMACTAAASDARMAGCTLSAMSNSGSGNQGVTVTMPVISIAEKTGASHEQLMRAIALAHLVAIHIKGYLGRLSALCGCVIASTGASCGIVYLRGGGYEEVCSSIKNMIGNITGMVCDGAKVGCALKVASGVACALQSAVLALEGKCFSPNDGIIEEDIEKTISNLGRIGSVGMRSTDEMILDIMTCK